MKKRIAILLALVMALALCVPAFASSNIPTTGSNSMDVQAQYVPGTSTSTGIVYSVVISWTPITALVYDGSVEYIWNADTHKYDVKKDADWTTKTTNVEITIINHSNAAIQATAEYKDAEGGPATQAELDNGGSVVCASAAEGITNYQGQGEAKSGKITGTVEVTDKGAISADGKVGTITVTIAPKT